MEIEMTEKKKKAKRPLYFRILKKLMRSRYKEPRFIYLGEEFENGALILSNHEGTDSPMSLEIYCDKPIRMWGTGEMNSGLISLYKYQTRYYYHEKKHWNLHLARLFCLLASPLTWLRCVWALIFKCCYICLLYRKTAKNSLEKRSNRRVCCICRPGMSC